MHHYYTLLALDLANERTAEAERAFLLRRGFDPAEPHGVRRRLADAVRGLRSMLVDAMPTERRTRPTPHAGHTH